MHIAIITEAWQPIWGGGQVYIQEVARQLFKTYGDTTDIFTMRLRSQDQEVMEIEPGIRIIRAGQVRHFTIVGRLGWIALATKAITTYHQQKPYDIIHAHATLPALSGLLARARLERPLVYTVHGANFMDMRAIHPFTLVEYILFTRLRYDCEISVNQSFLKYDNRNYPLVIPGGIYPEDFRPVTEKHSATKRLLYVGRLEQVKGLFKLIEACRLLTQNPIFNTAKLTIAGDGSLKHALEVFVKKYQLSDQITFLGAKSSHEVASLFEQSDMFVLPSLSEGFSLALLEAAAAGLPVVATDVGDNHMLVKNNLTGVLVAPGSAADLARGLSILLSQKDLGQWGRRIQHLAHTYTWEQTARATREAYNACI